MQGRVKQDIVLSKHTSSCRSAYAVYRRQARVVADAAGAKGDEGRVSEERVEQMEQRLLEWCSRVSVTRDESLHTVSIVAVSDAFDGYGHMDRQRKVIKALQDELSDLVFAVDEITALSHAEDDGSAACNA